MIAVLFALLLGPAAHADDPVLEGIVAEVERAAQLRLPDHGPPHHILVAAADGWETRARAHFGQVDWRVVRPLDDLKVEVRAGTPEFDSTGLGTSWMNTGISTGGLPDVPSARTVREAVWFAIDTQYKAAVENLGRKLGAREDIVTPDSPDLAWQVIGDPVVSVHRTPVGAPALEPAVALVEAVSGTQRDSGFLDVEVELSERVGHRIIVGSDGTRVVTPLRWVWLGLEIRARAGDDEERTFRDFVVARTRGELPPRKAIEARLQALAELARDWARAPRLEEPWYGPVVAEADVASDLFQRRVVNEVLGTPATAEWQRWDQKARPGRDGFERPGTRVLPRGWSVVDDTSKAEEARCCWTIDGEGVRARPVTLVDDGVIVGHLMTRTPNRYFGESTGHARPSGGRSREMAHPNNIIVTPPARVSGPRLRKLAAREARRQGLDRVLVLRESMSWGYWLYADGREVPVRGLKTSELDGRALRTLTVVGPMRTALRNHGRERFTVPDLLFPDVAITPSTPRPEAPRRRQSPLAGRGGSAQGPDGAPPGS